MAEKITPPDWIYPGAKVLLVIDEGSKEIRTVRAVVDKINKISFSLVRRDIRVASDTLKCRTGSTWMGTRYEVVDPDSERGLVLWRNEERRRTKVKAQNETKEWLTGDLESLDAIDAAITALQTWRAAAAVPPEQDPTTAKKGWLEEA